MRKRIYNIIEPAQDGDKASLAYDIFMLIAITASIIPLMFVEDSHIFRVIEQITVTLFIIDYMLRWITSDYRAPEKGIVICTLPFYGVGYH